MTVSLHKRAVWDTERVLSDMTMRGWNTRTLAKQANLSFKTVSKFLSGEVQTAKTAKKLADAMGYSVRRYFSRLEAMSA